ncbi:MAG: hypothetical protein U0Y08_09930 [Bacteroidia bacterium]
MKPTTIFIGLLLLFGNNLAMAQKEIVPSAALEITGAIQEKVVLDLSVLKAMKDSVYGDKVLVNHKGEIRDTLRDIHGIPLTRILENVNYKFDQARELSRFVFILKATDGYTVAISWNELYNSSHGQSFCIISSADGVKMADMKNRIAFIAFDDLISGRRFVKSLKYIDVKKLD